MPLKTYEGPTPCKAQQTYLESLEPGGNGQKEVEEGVAGTGKETEEQAVLALSDQCTLHLYDQPVWRPHSKSCRKIGV